MKRTDDSEGQDGQRKSEKQPVDPSQTNGASGPSQKASGNQVTGFASSSKPNLTRRQQETEKSRKRKEDLEAKRSKLPRVSKSRDWSTMSAWQIEQMAAAENASSDSLMPVEGSTYPLPTAVPLLATPNPPPTAPTPSPPMAPTPSPPMAPTPSPTAPPPQSPLPSVPMAMKPAKTSVASSQEKRPSSIAESPATRLSHSPAMNFNSSPTQSFAREPKTDGQTILDKSPSESEDTLRTIELPSKEAFSEVENESTPPASFASPEVPDDNSNKANPSNRMIAVLLSTMSYLSDVFLRVVQKITEENDQSVDVEFQDTIDISSDEEEDDWSVSDSVDQMDSEWLDLSDFEVYEDQSLLKLPEGQTSEDLRSKSSKRISPYQYPLKFLYVMLPVYKVLLCLGRFPFEIDMSEDIPVYKLNRKSWRYFLFIGTSLLALLASVLMVANLVVIVTTRNPLTFHETILHLEQEKYWIEATLEIVNMIFVAACSVSLLKYENGVVLVDFLNRWSQSVSIIRYDVTPGLRNMVHTFFWFYGIYAVFIIVLFFAGGDTIPTVRGMCGYTGILILNTCASELRLRPGFHAVEFFGLIVHLYTTLAGSLVILLISMQCWALDNAAQRFNRRLAACLRGAGFRSLASVPPTSRVVVPYTKLFAEHLVITSFPRHIGETFYFGFVVYLGCKMAEMIITLFGAAEPLVNGFPESKNETFFNVSAQSHFDPQLIVPIMIIEPSHIHSFKCVMYVVKTWLPWFIFMEIVQRPGTSILRGASRIVRNSYIMCKTTHALRFIASMKFSFSNRAVFFVNPGTQITRSFMGKFVGFALLIFLTLMQFSPSEVNSQGVLVCDHLGGCFLFRFPAKSRTHDGFQKSIGKTISDERGKTPKPLLPPPVYEKHFDFPPCVFGGLLPVNQSASFGFNCSHKEDSVFIPTYFRNSSKKFIQIPPTPDHSCVKSSELPLNETLFDCYGDEVEVVESDECGNPRLPTTDLQGIKKFPDLQVVKFNSSEIFCCYAYGGLENQAERCNLMSTEAASHKCSRKSRTEDRLKYEKSISALWYTSSESFFRMRELWTGCLCQGLDGIPYSESVCAASLLPEGPCPEYTPIKNPCKQCESDSRKMFRDHFFYRCPVEGLPGRFFTLPNPVKLIEDSKGLVHPVPWGYPCEKRTTIKDRSEEKGDYYDCYGNHMDMKKHLYKDDCGTQSMFFPSRFNGELDLPSFKVVQLDGSVPPRPGAAFLFVCCWDYEQWQDRKVNSKCNTYPGSDLTKICSLRSAISETEAIRACDDVIEKIGYNKLYIEKCVDPKTNKTRDSCLNSGL